MPLLLARRLAPAAAALLLAACGGSTDSAVTITGTVTGASTAGASIVVRDAAGAQVGEPVTVAADGTFRLTVPEAALAGELVFAAGGGASGAAPGGARLAAVAPAAVDLAARTAAGALRAGRSVHLTPQSTIVADMVNEFHPLADAEQTFAAAFGFTPDPTVAPLDAALPAAPTAADLERARAALRAGAFARLAADLGVDGPALYPALAEDLGDGLLDGLAGDTPVSAQGVALPVDLQNRFAAALVAWRADAANHTGLTTGQIGDLPFGLVALTSAYRIEYLPGVLPAAVGKTSFRLRVADRATGEPVTGLAVGLMPVMRMPTMSHATPVDAVTEVGGGEYDATAYYVMPSGPDMGYWELGVTVGGMGGEKATFYPPVGVRMGGTAMARLTGGAADQVAGTMGPSARTYQVFAEGFSLSAGLGTFRLLVATMDTMMSFPQVAAGATLHDGTSAAVTVAAVQVRVSADEGVTWKVADHVAGGHYAATGLEGLVEGQEATLQVELSVDLGGGLVVKRTLDGAAGFAAFTATPLAPP